MLVRWMNGGPGRRWLPASSTGLLLATEPVWVLVISHVFLGERATAAVLAGGVLVIAGVLITGDWMARQRRTAVTAGAAPPR
jgi:drug/metabolite transporter (DMT)-like permease